MDQIQPYLDYFAANPNWAIALIFLIAFGEALLIIGLVVPSTLVLVGAGALVGTGKLGFWPVMIATTVGCILGDQVSYWAGRIFGDRLRTFWPLSAYPHLVAKGEDFFRKHGGKSVALGRFVPGVKAVVPGIAGMLGMGEIFFLTVNISSGIVWSIAHLLPGILLGQALALAGELSGRLVVILLLLLVVLGVGGWLIRVLAAGISPYRRAAQGRLAAWARSTGKRPLRRFARAIAPENPRSVLILWSFVLSLIALFALIDIVSGRIIRNAVGNLDYSLFNLFAELRNATADELFIRVTMLGDDIVLFATALGGVLWLLAKRNWRLAAATILTVIIANFAVMGLSLFSGPAAPAFANLAATQLIKFPSGHTIMAGVVFGCFMILASRSMGRWTQSLIAATCGGIVLAIAFSRLYLGVSWLSDVFASLMLAAIIATIYGVVVETLPLQRIKPWGLLTSGLAAFLLSGALHISTAYETNEDNYAARDRTITLPLTDWVSAGWKKAQMRRIDMAGKPEEIFVGQWLGPLPPLRTALEGAGFKVLPKWTWKDSFTYLDPHAPLANLSPRPSLHEGLKAKLTAIETQQQDPAQRITVRVFASNFQVTNSTTQPVYFISVTREIQYPRFNLFSVPSDQATSPEEQTNVFTKLLTQPQVEKLAEEKFEAQTVLILRAKE